ncbi:autotransporter domain-containing protein [Azospirillum sp. sgz301742]
MRRTLFVHATLPILLAMPAGALAQSYSGVQAFGDSLTDNGNLFALTRAIQPVPASPPYFDGRFSNGPVWVEHLMPRLGLPSTALDDRAYGGAETGLGPSPSPGVLAQVSGAVTFGPRPGPSTLVVVWGGANDYRNHARTAPDPAVLVDSAINNLRDSLQLLINAGAREILVPNVPNLGDTPEGREQDATAPGTAARINAIIAGHNAALAQTVDRLRRPGVRITLLDVNALFRDVLTAPGRYGFTNTTVPCLLGVAPDVGADSGACSTPQGAATTVFFDKLHPTTAAHAIVAQFADSTLRAPMAGGNAAPARAQMAFLSAAEQARAISERLAALRGGFGGIGVLGSGLSPLTGGTAGGVSEGNRLDVGAASDRPFGLFLYGTHDWGNREAREGQDAFHYRGSLVALGADYRVTPGLTLGAAIGYGFGSSSLDEGRAEAHSTKLSAYAGYQAGGFYADADLGYSFDQYPDIRRSTGFAFLPQARGETHGNTLSADATVGYDVPVGTLTLGPFVGGRYARIRTDSFTERDAGALNLRVDGTSATSLTGAVGLRLGGVFSAGTAKVAPHVRLAYEHEFSHDARRITASLSGASLTAEPGVGARDALVAGVGVRVQVSDRLSLVADYAGTLARADGRDHSLLGKVEVKF